MADFVEKEKYEGTWNGKQVRFTRSFRGKRLTDEQCEALLAGRQIEIPGLKSKAGNEYGVIGQLAELEYNGHPYVGVEQVDFMKSHRGVPRMFCGKELTEDERTMLEAGKPVRVEGLISKRTGKTFAATLTYNADEDKIDMDFDKK